MNLTVDEIRKRIFSVIEASSVHMNTLLRLVGINVTDNDKYVDSAAVSCSSTPVMTINQNFVQKYCKTDEHLLMLVMHELYHVILGHTTFFNRNSDIDNITFDAVINSMLCRSFPSPKFVSFFEKLNPSNSFPGCLLRPAAPDTPTEFIDILKVLYESDTGTYYEVYNLLKQKIVEIDIERGGILIGNHKTNSKPTDPNFKKTIDEIISKWPRNIIVAGRDMGGKMQDMNVNLENPEILFRRKLLNLMFRSGSRNNTNNPVRVKRVAEDFYKGQTFIPQSTDRFAIAKRMISAGVYMYNAKYTQRVIKSDVDVKTLVYLDVSGSVTCELSKFISAILPAFKKGLCEIYSFSTEVYKPEPSDLINGNYKSTGGTDGNCIFKHYYSLPPAKRKKNLLLITDGEIGAVECVEKLRRDGICVNVALMGSCNEKYVAGFANRIEYFD